MEILVQPTTLDPRICDEGDNCTYYICFYEPGCTGYF